MDLTEKANVYQDEWEQPAEEEEKAKEQVKAVPAKVEAGPSDVQNTRVYIGNLSWSASEKILHEHFSQVGEIVAAKVFQHPNGQSKGCGVVQYKEPAGATAAIEKLNGTEIYGRVITVKEDDGRRRTPQYQDRKTFNTGPPRSNSPYNSGNDSRFREQQYNARAGERPSYVDRRESGRDVGKNNRSELRDEKEELPRAPIMKYSRNEEDERESVARRDEYRGDEQPRDKIVENGAPKERDSEEGDRRPVEYKERDRDRERVPELDRELDRERDRARVEDRAKDRMGGRSRERPYDDRERREINHWDDRRDGYREREYMRDRPPYDPEYDRVGRIPPEGYRRVRGDGPPPPPPSSRMEPRYVERPEYSYRGGYRDRYEDEPHRGRYRTRYRDEYRDREVEGDERGPWDDYRRGYRVESRDFDPYEQDRFRMERGGYEGRRDSPPPRRRRTSPPPAPLSPPQRYPRSRSRTPPRPRDDYRYERPRDAEAEFEPRKRVRKEDTRYEDEEEDHKKRAGPGANVVKRDLAGRKVIVLNLPFEIGWQELKDSFKVAGPIAKAEILIEPNTGRSIGRGTITFESEEGAKVAIDKFDQTYFYGRKVLVKVDERPYEERPSTFTMRRVPGSALFK